MEFWLRIKTKSSKETQKYDLCVLWSIKIDSLDKDIKILDLDSKVFLKELLRTAKKL